MTLFSACVLAARGDEQVHPRDQPAKERTVKAKTSLSIWKMPKIGCPRVFVGLSLYAGEVLRTKVVHLATVETKIKGTAPDDEVRTISTRAWRIQEVDAAGNITFDNRSSKWRCGTASKDGKEVHYNSETDKTPPPDFAQRRRIGRQSAGHDQDRSLRADLSRQNAQAALQPRHWRPDGSVSAGRQAADPGRGHLVDSRRTEAPQEDGTIKKIQTQQQYKLEKVEAGVATIAVATQVLTPINDPKLQSQFVQRLQKGTIQFDLDAGRLLAQAARHRSASVWL